MNARLAVVTIMGDLFRIFLLRTFYEKKKNNIRRERLRHDYARLRTRRKKCSFRNLEFGICVSFVINWPENGNFKRECECRARVSLLILQNLSALSKYRDNS